MASKDSHNADCKPSQMASKDNADFQRSLKDSHLQGGLQDASAVPPTRPELAIPPNTPPPFQDGSESESEAFEGACGLPPAHLQVPSSPNNTLVSPVARKRWHTIPKDSLEVTKKRIEEESYGKDGPDDGMQNQ